MCNAWNHAPGCTCGFGGEGHLGRSPGNFGLNRYSYHSRLESPTRVASSWKLTELGHHLTFETQCWWCDAWVFFHTNGNGDCVLFDELGPPWLVHECWELHCKEQSTAISHYEGSLRTMGYDGSQFRLAGIRRKTKHNGFKSSVDFHRYSSHSPMSYSHSNLTSWHQPEKAGSVPVQSARFLARPSSHEVSSVVAVTGFVVKNHGLDPGAVGFLIRLGRNATTSVRVILEVNIRYNRICMVLLPVSVTANVENYSIVRVTGRWLKGLSVWFLVAESLEKLEYPDENYVNLYSQECGEVSFLYPLYCGFDPD